MAKYQYAILLEASVKHFPISEIKYQLYLIRSQLDSLVLDGQFAALQARGRDLFLAKNPGNGIQNRNYLTQE